MISTTERLAANDEAERHYHYMQGISEAMKIPEKEVDDLRT
jgi:hypothetical protein